MDMKQQNYYYTWVKCPDLSVIKINCLKEWTPEILYYRIINFILFEKRIQQKSSIILKVLGSTGLQNISSVSDFVISFQSEQHLHIYEYILKEVEEKETYDLGSLGEQLHAAIRFMQEEAWDYVYSSEQTREQTANLLEELNAEIEGYLFHLKKPSRRCPPHPLSVTFARQQEGLCSDADTLYSPQEFSTSLDATDSFDFEIKPLIENEQEYLPLGDWVHRMKNDQESEPLIVKEESYEAVKKDYENTDVKRVKAWCTPMPLESVPNSPSKSCLSNVTKKKTTPPPIAKKPEFLSKSSDTKVGPPHVPFATKTLIIPALSTVEYKIHYPKLRPLIARQLLNRPNLLSFLSSYSKSDVSFILNEVIASAKKEFEEYEFI